MRVMVVRQSLRRRAAVATWAICIALCFVPATTEGVSANSYSFSSHGVLTSTASSTVFREATPTTAFSVESESRIAGQSTAPPPSTSLTTSSVVTRPKTADEEVIEAEAELIAHSPIPSTSKPPTLTAPPPPPLPTPPTPTTTPPTPTMTPAPTQTPKPIALPIIAPAVVKPTATPDKNETPSPTTIAPPTPTPTPTPAPSLVTDLSKQTVISTSRGADAGSSLDKTIVIVIVGIVAAIGVLALVVSRQIKNSLGDGDYSDDEL